MCGRFWVQNDINAKQLRLQLESFQPGPKSFNISPGRMVDIIVTQAGQNQVIPMRWGLIPSWAKEARIGYKMINARAETITEKPSFRKLFITHRCLVPCDGFYEWQQTGVGKRPYAIRLKNAKPFTLAGLWTHWQAPNGQEVKSFTIITIAANTLMQKIHHRMPVIIPEARRGAWLDEKQQDPVALQTLLKPFAASQMEMYEVSTVVNSPRHDDEQCTRPADEERKPLGEEPDEQ